MVFSKGHRLQLDVQPRDGLGSQGYMHYHADYNDGTNTIHAGGPHESYLLLPVIPALWLSPLHEPLTFSDLSFISDVFRSTSNGFNVPALRRPNSELGELHAELSLANEFEGLEDRASEWEVTVRPESAFA